MIRITFLVCYSAAKRERNADICRRAETRDATNGTIVETVEAKMGFFIRTGTTIALRADIDIEAGTGV